MAIERGQAMARAKACQADEIEAKLDNFIAETRDPSKGIGICLSDVPKAVLREVADRYRRKGWRVNVVDQPYDQRIELE